MEPGALLRRPQGLDGGLEDLGAGLQLGSPDRKKSKSGAQGVPFPAPPYEYTLLPNPSAKPTPLMTATPPPISLWGVGFGGYNAFRMPPYLLSQTASPYWAPAFPLRHQPPPFEQSPAGTAFIRAPAVTFGPPENTMGFGHQPSYSASQALPR